MARSKEKPTLRELKDRFFPEPPEITSLTLEETAYLVGVTLKLADFIREIHYNHLHACTEGHNHSKDQADLCIKGAYEYLSEIGD